MKTIGIFFLFSLCQYAQARPEYALLYNQVSCTACHESPTGGGIRTLEGKLFGAHELKLAKFSQRIEWFQMDFRSEAFQSKTDSRSQKGLLIMTTNASANIPMQIDDDEPAPLNFVANYGLGRLQNGLSDAYLRYNLAPNTLNPIFQHVVLGRFLPPFGLLTDEHRTYVKIQVPSSMLYYESGAMLSGTPSYAVHYDVAMTSGVQSDTPAVDDAPWGVFFNIRTIPWSGPFMLGASYSRHGTSQVRVQPQASDFYILYSAEKSTHDLIPLTLIGEITEAMGWDNSTVNPGMSNFIPSSGFSNWQTALNDSRSRGYLMQANWDCNNRWQLNYRMEQFTPDIDFTGDAFYRYGFGGKYFMSGNSSILARYEHAFATRPGVTENGTVRAVGDSMYVFLHFWL